MHPNIYIGHQIKLGSQILYLKGRTAMTDKTTTGQGKYNIQKWDDYLQAANLRMVRTDNTCDTWNKYKNDFLNFMRNYADMNCEILQEVYENYQKAISTDFFDEHYELIDESELHNLLSVCKVLLITANPIEKAMLHYCVTQSKEGARIRRIISDTNAYFIFKWGRYWIAHIHQPQTGAFKNLGLNSTLTEALRHFSPNVIISVGVAFGIDYQTQNIGDVIVSRKLYPYSENKRDEDIVKPDRSQDKVIDDWLDVRFVNANGFLDGVTYGGILSGGSVMSSFEEKDRVCVAYSKGDYVVGGEMEGSALFQISQSRGIPCAVIKGICDWGVAKNDIFPDAPEQEEVFKDSLQAYAMSQVVKKCYPLFRDGTIFSSSKMKQLEVEKRRNKCLLWNNLFWNTVLFILGLVAREYFEWRYESYLTALFIVIPLVSILCSLFNFLPNKWTKRKLGRNSNQN